MESKLLKPIWILSEGDRSQGFIRPLRVAYIHVSCGTVSTLGKFMAEIFAGAPCYYADITCAHCRTQFLVSEFRWRDSGEVVGS